MFQKYNNEFSSYIDSVNPIEELFTNSQFFQFVQFNNSIIEARIQSTKNENVKKLQLKPGTELRTGNIVELPGGSKWITIDSQNNGVLPKCTIQQTNHILKWQNSEGEIIQAPAIIIDNTTVGIEDNKWMILPGAKFQAILDADERNVLLTRGKRFILNQSAWKCIFIDRTTRPGLLMLILDEDLIKSSDDMENEIADYVPMTEPEEPEEPSEPGEGMTVEISGPGEIYVGSSASYDATFYLNGNSITGIGTWQLFADNQENTTTLANIQSQTDSSCTVKPNSNTGYVQLKCTVVDYPEVFSWKRIWIRSLW